MQWVRAGVRTWLDAVRERGRDAAVLDDETRRWPHCHHDARPVRRGSAVACPDCDPERSVLFCDERCRAAAAAHRAFYCAAATGAATGTAPPPAPTVPHQPDPIPLRCAVCAAPTQWRCPRCNEAGFCSAAHCLAAARPGGAHRAACDAAMPYVGALEVRASAVHGRGLFATRAIPAGVPVAVCAYPVPPAWRVMAACTAPSCCCRLAMSEHAAYVNHSAEAPNVVVRARGQAAAVCGVLMPAFFFCSAAPIAAGAELLADYWAAPWFVRRPDWHVPEHERERAHAGGLVARATFSGGAE